MIISAKYEQFLVTHVAFSSLKIVLLYLKDIMPYHYLIHDEVNLKKFVFIVYRREEEEKGDKNHWKGKTFKVDVRNTHKKLRNLYYYYIISSHVKLVFMLAKKRRCVSGSCWWNTSWIEFTTVFICQIYMNAW